MTRTEGADKIRETRLRRMAARQGLALWKSRRRDPRAIDYGKYMIVNPRLSNAVVVGASPYPFSLNLDEVEDWLLHGFTHPEDGGDA